MDVSDIFKHRLMDGQTIFRKGVDLLKLVDQAAEAKQLRAELAEANQRIENINAMIGVTPLPVSIRSSADIEPDPLVDNSYTGIIAQLRAELAAMTLDLKGSENVNAYLNKQNIGIAKEIGELRAEVARLTAELQRAREFHPRAMKLIGKRKDFIVIAEDEPYFVDAYMAIRRHEKFIKRWTAEDEQRYREAFTRWHQAQTNALPTPPEQEAK